MQYQRRSCRRSGGSWLWRPAALACLLLVGGAGARAQQPDLLLPPQPAPPPMRYIPDAVRAQLNAARDPKARTRLALAEAEARLVAAEQQTAARQYDPAAAALGVYQAVVTDAISYLEQNGGREGKQRDLFKQLEQTLYKHSARIEALRRVTPPEYAGNIRAALNHARDARTAALDAFYGHTVLRDHTLERNKAALQEGAQPQPAGPKPPAPLSPQP